MTRKDYELIARTMRNAQTISALSTRDLPLYRQQWVKDCEELADAFAAQNPRFDRARFLAACGIN